MSVTSPTYLDLHYIYKPSIKHIQQFLMSFSTHKLTISAASVAMTLAVYVALLALAVVALAVRALQTRTNCTKSAEESKMKIFQENVPKSSGD